MCPKNDPLFFAKIKRNLICNSKKCQSCAQHTTYKVFFLTVFFLSLNLGLVAGIQVVLVGM